MTKKNTKPRKITLEEWSFRWTTVGIGCYRDVPMRWISNEYIAKTLSWYENLPDKSPAIKVFDHMYLKLLRERCLRKRFRNYTIKVGTYFNYPRNLGGRACRRNHYM